MRSRSFSFHAPFERMRISDGIFVAKLQDGLAAGDRLFHRRRVEEIDGDGFRAQRAQKLRLLGRRGLSPLTW